MSLMFLRGFFLAISRTLRTLAGVVLVVGCVCPVGTLGVPVTGVDLPDDASDTPRMHLDPLGDVLDSVVGLVECPDGSPVDVI